MIDLRNLVANFSMDAVNEVSSERKFQTHKGVFQTYK